jgi:hypothetical protein
MRTRLRHVRALAVVALMTAALSSLAGTAAAEKLVVLEPAHGLPGVSVNVTMGTTESSQETSEGDPPPQATGSPICGAYWDDEPDPVVMSECDVDRNANISWSASFTVPEGATEGAHKVTVRYVRSVEGTEFEPVTFTVDAPVVTSQEPPPNTTTEPTGDPTEVTDDPTSTDAAASPDETIPTTNADASTSGPPGIVVIMAALALIAAGVLSWMIRGLRQRSSKWVSQHVRVVAAAGPLQIIESGSRRRPTTSVRLEIHRNEPRQERPQAMKGSP